MFSSCGAVFIGLAVSGWRSALLAVRLPSVPECYAFRQFNLLVRVEKGLTVPTIFIHWNVLSLTFAGVVWKLSVPQERPTLGTNAPRSAAQ